MKIYQRRNLLIHWLLFGCLATLTTTAEARARCLQPRHVQTIEQTSGESGQEFIVRVGRFLADRQAETGHESCGSICSDPGGSMAVMVFTGDSPTRCPVVRGCPLTHMTLTKDFIHSHPDNMFMGFFSGMDYEVGPGYLVRGKDMFYQSGRGTKRRWPTPGTSQIDASSAEKKL